MLQKSMGRIKNKLVTDGIKSLKITWSTKYRCAY